MNRAHLQTPGVGKCTRKPWGRLRKIRMARIKKVEVGTAGPGAHCDASPQSRVFEICEVAKCFSLKALHEMGVNWGPVTFPTFKAKWNLSHTSPQKRIGLKTQTFNFLLLRTPVYQRARKRRTN